jgi:hypothetical protein
MYVGGNLEIAHPFIITAIFTPADKKRKAHLTTRSLRTVPVNIGLSCPVGASKVLF